MDRTLETLRPSRQRAGAGAGRVISPQTRYEAEAVEALSFGGREGVSQDATTSNSYVPRRSHQRHIVIVYIVVQNKVSSFVFISVLGARVGEILRNNLYISTECLCYKDIILRLYKNDQSKNIQAIITIR